MSSVYQMHMFDLEFDPRLAAVTPIPELIELEKSKAVGDKRELHLNRAEALTTQWDSLVLSVKEHGVIEPLKVKTQGGQILIIDGRHRFLAAKEAGLDSVPCVYPDSFVEDDRLLILDSENRRHLSKGAIAYRGVLLYPEVALDSKERQKRKSVCSATVAEQTQDGSSMDAEGLATRIGVGLRTVETACALYRIFDKHSPLKEKHESSVWTCASIAKLQGEMAFQADALENDMKVEKDPEALKAKQLKKQRTKLGGQFLSLSVKAVQIAEDWEVADDDVREKMREGLVGFVESLPEECLKVLTEKLK